MEFPKTVKVTSLNGGSILRNVHTAINVLATNGDSYNYNILMLYKKIFVKSVSELLEKEYTRGFLEGATYERTYQK